MALQIREGGAPSMKIKGKADVVFCIDGTGSMRQCIENLKNHISDFVESLNSGNNVFINWRLRTITYKDLEFGEQIQTSNHFVTKVEDFQSQLTTVRVGGGGSDGPESTLDAIIYAAKTSDWREAHKIIVVFTDARTKEIHSSTKDIYGIHDMDELRKYLMDNHIKLFLWGKDDRHYNDLKIVPKAEITIMANPHAELSSEVNMADLLTLMGKTLSTEAAGKAT